MLTCPELQRQNRYSPPRVRLRLARAHRSHLFSAPAKDAEREIQKDTERHREAGILTQQNVHTMNQKVSEKIPLLSPLARVRQSTMAIQRSSHDFGGHTSFASFMDESSATSFTRVIESRRRLKKAAALTNRTDGLQSTAYITVRMHAAQLKHSTALCSAGTSCVFSRCTPYGRLPLVHVTARWQLINPKSENQS